ncbi:MAG TPA: J domain-containing protein [Ramlibacter sp.]|nr:J domain-containing protein [Ramlibacter sp.]
MFSSIREVLQIAIARDGAASPLADAARFFVRTALLFSSADHYALLGLRQDASDADLKNRYRLLMRLLHPDFSSGWPYWPPDAAVRVNLAYETLSSPAKRGAYDAARTERASTIPTPPKAKTSPRRLKTRTGGTRGKRMAMVVSFAMAMVLMGALTLGTPTGVVELVQRMPHGNGKANAELRPTSDFSADPAHETPSLGPLGSGNTTDRPLALAAMVATAAVPPTLAADRPMEPELLASALNAAATAPTAQAAAAPPVVSTPPLALVLPTPTATPPAAPAMTLTDAHPLLSRLLQHMESGSGERLLTVVEPSERSHPSAQAVVKHYNRLVNGARTVKLSDAAFKAEGRDGGRLVVTGTILMRVGDEPENANRDFSLQAEFALKEGHMVMTRLRRVQE